MLVIIAGNRNFMNQSLVDFVMDKLTDPNGEYKLKIEEIVCGMAPGADECGYNWSKRHKIPIEEFYAKWTEFGLAAGPKRNAEMAKYVGKDGALVLFDFGNGKGSASMRSEAKKIGMKIFEVKDEIRKLNGVDTQAMYKLL